MPQIDAFACLCTEISGPEDWIGGGARLNLIAIAGWLLGHDLGSSWQLGFALSNQSAGLVLVQPVTPIQAKATHGLDSDGLGRLGSILEAIRRIRPATPVVRASELLASSLAQTRDDVRHVLMWSALEALFGPDKGEGVVHKVAERIAQFLGGSSADRLSNYDAAKEGYSYRSRVVHGAAPRRPPSAAHWLEDTLRGCLLQALTRKEVMKLFCSKQRDRYLTELAITGRLEGDME